MVARMVVKIFPDAWLREMVGQNLASSCRSPWNREEPPASSERSPLKLLWGG